MKTKILALVIMLLIAITCLVGCRTDDFSIKFIVDGEIYEELIVGGLKIYEFPKDPKKDGYIFKGWYYDKDFIEPCTKPPFPVYTNYTLYAKFEILCSDETHTHEWVVTKNPTCSVPGETEYVCKKCNITFETRIIPTLPHDFSESQWMTIKDPTCKDVGIKQQRCKNCDFANQEYIPITDKHTPAEPTIENKIEATCKYYGMYDEVIYCRLCNEKISKNTVIFDTNLKDHVLNGKPKVTTILGDCYTLSQEVTTNDCINCYKKIEIGREDIPNSYHHRYKEIVTPPTVNSEGYTNHVCDYCGYSYQDNYVPALHVVFTYKVTSDGYYSKTCTVTGVESYKNALFTIPENIDGYTVTAIGDRAFSEMTEMTSITIPNTVTSIGTRAFYGCSGLTEITIPSSVSNIGTQVFYKCNSLHTVYYNGSYGSSENAFLCTTSIKKVVLGGSKVPNYALHKCHNIENVVIAEGVSSIGRDAFNGCSGIISIEIPDSVISIGSYAFMDCSKLEEINIPIGISAINDRTFYNSSSLTSIVIPDSVTFIDYYAFNGCSSLTSIVIPDSVTSIDTYAFNGCSSLETVYYTGTPAFWNEINISAGNSNLTNATIYYYSETKPSDDGNYWYYDADGKVAIW